MWLGFISQHQSEEPVLSAGSVTLTLAALWFGKSSPEKDTKTHSHSRPELSCSLLALSCILLKLLVTFFFFSWCLVCLFNIGHVGSSFRHFGILSQHLCHCVLFISMIKQSLFLASSAFCLCIWKRKECSLQNDKWDSTVSCFPCVSIIDLDFPSLSFIWNVEILLFLHQICFLPNSNGWMLSDQWQAVTPAALLWPGKWLVDPPWSVYFHL